MLKLIAGNLMSPGVARRAVPCARSFTRDRRGVILLAVLVFVAALLPLVTLVLTSINTESVSTAEAIKGAKTELASEKSLNDAISLVVQEKYYPDYWTSATQPNTAIIVVDPVTGFRRNELPDVAPPNLSGGAAGLDDQLGTGDDYWVGPRKDRSYIGDSLTGTMDNVASSRNYQYDFRFPNLHAPTYLGQSWSFSSENDIYSRSPFNGQFYWLFNQSAAVDSDQTNPPVDDGYDPADPFGGNTNAVLYGPGYYTGADEPRLTPGGPAIRALDDGSIREAMYNAKISIYNSVFTNLDRGPIPSSLLKSYANVTDEAGRLNLNIFMKKIPVMMEENSNTDYDFYGYGTNDFNYNTVTGEVGWKWMNNPLFPDAKSSLKLNFNPFGTDDTGVLDNDSSKMFSLDDYNGTGRAQLDFGSVSGDPSTPFSSAPDLHTMSGIGESVQHYYEGDTDGDGISDSVESMIQSIRMLMTIPGIGPELAANILQYMNPSLDYFEALAASRGHAPGYYVPGSGSFTGSNDEAYVVPETGILREDACNITPPLMAVNIQMSGGTVTDFNWDFNFCEFDDLPLPPPRPLRTLEELLNVPGMTKRKYERVKDYLTIFSYDTNVIGTNIQDVSPNADLANAYVPGDPLYNGALSREVPDNLRDEDDLADLRFDVARFVPAASVSEYRNSAEEMYAYIREHLPRTMFDKVTLPAVDRLGRAAGEETYIPNDDTMYDLSAGGELTTIGLPPMVPHRDGDGDVDGTGRSHPYNVGRFGHQQDVTVAAGTLPGAGYPALNPAFSLESCMSIVMYRNGTLFEEDDYSYNPTDGAWLPAANRLPPGFLALLPPEFFGLFGLGFGDFVNNDPNPEGGFNVNPRIRPHGQGATTLANFSQPQDLLQSLLMPDSFDSAADLLDIPLYEFGRMSVSLMADPPSDYRFDLNNSGTVDGGHPEQGAVNYYISFSDVVNLQWYMENVHPLGPNNVNDGGYPNGDDPDMNKVLYEVRFTAGNHSGITALPDQTVPNTGDFDCLLPITPLQLRAIGGGLSSSSIDVTIVAFDNVNNKSFLSSDFTGQPGNLNTAFTDVGGAGSLSVNFPWDEVPLPEDPPGSSITGRPLLPSNWPVLPPADPEKWAYDNVGNPYITARVEVVKADGGPILGYDTPDRTAVEIEDVRCDDKATVFMQYNEESLAPLRVDTLPVRVNADQFEIRTAVGGFSTDGGSYLLYDWGYENGAGIFDFPSGYDGTWPTSVIRQPGQATDPRTARISPEYSDVVLRVYDLRRFEDDNHAPFDANPPDRVAPSQTSPNNGYPELTLGNYPNGLWDDGLPGGISGRVLPPGGDGTGLMGFPSAGTGPNGYPDPNYPLQNINDFEFGYAESRSSIEKITALLQIEAQVATEEPTAYLNDNSVRVHFSGAGGELDYDFRLRLLTSADGGPGGLGDPYDGPDGLGGSTWPNPAGGRSSRITGGGLAYNAINPASQVVRQRFFNNYNEINGNHVFDLSGSTPAVDDPFGFGSLAPGTYWVEVRLTDRNGLFDFAYTKVQVGTSVGSGAAEVVAPAMNASINVFPLTIGGNNRVGFSASAGVDGGSGAYSYYWALTRPVYGNVPATIDTIIGEEIVDASAPFVGIASDATASTAGSTSAPMTSNSPNPTFEFHAFDNIDNQTGLAGSDGMTDANGTYFLHLYVIDGASSHPSGADPFIAHDVALVTIADGTAGTGLTRTPMSLLAASAPGNRNVLIGNNSSGVSGDAATRPSINPSGIDPRIAGRGEVIIINGTNFNAGSPTSNIVRFGGDVTARAFRATATQLWVVVPENAQPGYVNVSNAGGTSRQEFFQTGYTVSFDLIGGLQTENNFLQFELDFQGDGHVDYLFSTMGDTNLPAQIRSTSTPITHDYADDGIGNYMATLTVTDMLGNRKQVSHQLITIADRNPALDVNNGMMANAWPDVELRSESFAPSADRGTEFHSSVSGESTAVQQKWLIDANAGGGSAGSGGILIASGSSKDFDTAGRRLHDYDTDFSTAGVLGVRFGDQVTNVEGSHNAGGTIPGTSGATATVSNLAGPNTVIMHDPTDTANGLSGGNDVLRSGIVTDRALISPGIGGIVEIQSTSPFGFGLYDWNGDTQGLVDTIYEGGFIVGDLIISEPDDSIWEIIALPPATANGFGWVRLQHISGGPGPGAPGQSQFRVVSATNMGGLPPRFQLDTSNNINWNTLPGLIVGGVGIIVTKILPGGDAEQWRIVDIPASNPNNAPFVGTLPDDIIEVEYVSGGNAPYLWETAPPSWGQIDIGGFGWIFGDEWSAAISGDEWRTGFAYTIYTRGDSGDGGTGLDSVAFADATYATEDAQVDFYFDLQFPFDLNADPTLPTEVLVDWNGDGAVDPADEYPVGRSSRFDGVVNNLEVESLTVTHNFFRGVPGDPLNEYGNPSLSGRGEPTFAQYWIRATPRTQPTVTYGPFSMPVVYIGGDDYDNDLTRLNVSDYDNDNWHRVATELQSGGFTVHASDTLLIPPGTDFPNTLKTWVSYNDPAISANAIGETTMRHQAVHGAGGSLNWMSDANADSVWNPSSNFESPLAANGQNSHEFRFQNGGNQMTDPAFPGLFNSVRGASFPQAAPGIGINDIEQFIYYRADSGIYNGYGFAADTLPPDERSFSFESQPLLLGEQAGGGVVPGALPLGVDFNITPQVGTTSQMVQLNGFVSGFDLNGQYNYVWQIQKVADPAGDSDTGFVGIGKIYDGSSATTSFVNFNPLANIADEGWYTGGNLGHGRYRVRLEVNGVTSAWREFFIQPPNPAIFVMADPPSATVGDVVQFTVFMEGGREPYDVTIDYGDGTPLETQFDVDGSFVTFFHQYEEPSPDKFSPDGDYEVEVTWVDSSGTTQQAGTVVKIADSIPLNASLLVMPASGVAPLQLEIHFTIAGGQKTANDGYITTISLTGSDGGFEDLEFRVDSNTFGDNGVLDDPFDPGADDEPVRMTVPRAGNYSVNLFAFDNNGQVTTVSESVYAAGYLMPIEYGDDRPEVVRDMEDRPMHAARIWVDPFLSFGTDPATQNYENRLDGSSRSGGRLMEGDLQVFGDIITTDPNQSFRSIGMFSSKDPYSQDLFTAGFNDPGNLTTTDADFYDTFTPGRINLNTASEQVLTALFRRIRASRGYDWNQTVDLDTNGDGIGDTPVPIRVVRDTSDDVYLSEASARALAQDVIRYRTMFYDHYKGNVESTGEFGYNLDSTPGSGGGLGNLRVDHLPVIGPWDGVNPRLYDVSNRGADLGACNDDLTNTWDHMAASYYNFDPGLALGNDGMFYSPSDIAVVRERITDGGISLNIPLPPVIGVGSLTIGIDEPLSNYAKYLNDVVPNDSWAAGDRGNHWTDWELTGLYPDSPLNYSDWSFDARNYFTYESGTISVDIVAGDPPVSTVGNPASARNNIAIIDSNGETAYTYIPNPPFRHLFDLYKVIDSSQAPRTFNLEASGGGNTIDTTFTDWPDGVTSEQVFSGPSRFRYVCRWDDNSGEFIPIANYLDDIAPYVTCRSYVFRVEAIGSVSASGGSAGAIVESARISRDRIRTAVVDIGPMWSRREVQQPQNLGIGDIRTQPDNNLSYNILWYDDANR